MSLTGLASGVRLILMLVIIVRCWVPPPDAPHLASACAFCSGPRLHGAETDPPYTPPPPRLQQGRTSLCEAGKPCRGVGVWGFSAFPRLLADPGRVGMGVALPWSWHRFCHRHCCSQRQQGCAASLTHSAGLITTGPSPQGCFFSVC